MSNRLEVDWGCLGTTIIVVSIIAGCTFYGVNKSRQNHEFDMKKLELDHKNEGANEAKTDGN